MALSRDDLIAICPPPKSGSKRAIWDGYVAALTSPEGDALLAKFEIDRPNRLIGLVACVFAPETGLTLLRESGNYSADRIVEVFGAPKHSSAITLAEAKRISALPINPDGTGPRADALFERAYGLDIAHCCKRVRACTNRNAKGKLVACQARSLGNALPGDGARHPGIGLNQCTGADAQKKMAAKIGCAVADLVKPINALHMALIEWQEKGCNAYADREDWVSIRKLINAGSLRVSIARINGLPEMTRALEIAKRRIAAEDFKSQSAGSLVAAKDVPPPESSAPLGLWQSTEVQMATATGSGGVATTGQAAQNAVMKTAGSGDWSWRMFALNLLSDPLFWTGVSAVAGAAYWFMKRRANFYIRGV